MILTKENEPFRSFDYILEFMPKDSAREYSEIWMRGRHGQFWKSILNQVPVSFIIISGKTSGKIVYLLCFIGGKNASPMPSSHRCRFSEMCLTSFRDFLRSLYSCEAIKLVAIFVKLKIRQHLSYFYPLVLAPLTV